MANSHKPEEFARKLGKAHAKMVEEFKQKFFPDGDRVNWEAVRDYYFERAGNTFLLRKYTFVDVDKLFHILLDEGLLAADPNNNYAIFRGCWQWGPHVGGLPLFFTDKENAIEYAKVFAFKHGTMDSGDAVIVKCDPVAEIKLT